METVKIENAQEFDSFLRSHPKGHMMQSSSWGKVKKEWEWRGFISRDTEGNIKGVCGVLLRQIPMTPFKMMYAPRGPVCDLNDKETVKELLMAVKEYGIKNKAYTFKIDTDTLASNSGYIELLKSLGFKFKDHSTGFDTIQARYIFRLDVGGKTEEEVMASFHPKTRYNARLAARKGVTIEIKGAEACEEFHELMLVTGERDNFATRDTSYFERIMEAFGDDARIYLAKFEGKTPEEVVAEFDGKGYGDFKKAVGEAVAEHLAPVRENYSRYLSEKAYLEDCYRKGAEQAERIAQRTIDKMYKKVELKEFLTTFDTKKYYKEQKKMLNR